MYSNSQDIFNMKYHPATFITVLAWYISVKVRIVQHSDTSKKLDPLGLNYMGQTIVIP